MDVTFESNVQYIVDNVLEGTRQYFLGVPKQASAHEIPEEGAPAQSGVPAPSSRPPSAAAAPPSAPSAMAVETPPRPSSDPIEPEPHIIHKATVMREAAEKRRELTEPDDEEEPVDAHSPPSHVIRKPPPQPSPAPAPAAPCPSPARPSSEVSLPPPPVPEPQLESLSQYRPSMHRAPTPVARPPDPFAPARPHDHYSASRPPETYSRYHMNAQEGSRNSQPTLMVTPQPSTTRYSPHYTYSRILTTHTMSSHSPRLRETPSHSPPTAQRYVMAPSQPMHQIPQHNDRVPPIHHHQLMQQQRPPTLDNRSGLVYAPLPRPRESSSYGRNSSHHERQTLLTPRKHDHQQPYPGYRQAQTVTQSLQNRMEMHSQHSTIDVRGRHYDQKPLERMPNSSHLHHENSRNSLTRGADIKNSYHYMTPSTSTMKSTPTLPSLPVVQNPSTQPRTGYRPAVNKSNYDCLPSMRGASKTGIANQPSRLTVSVTTIVNEMNQSKQKRESPLDLSVKTVKNSADSTAQDEVVDSVPVESKTMSLQPISLPSSRHVPPSANAGYNIPSHKVDFLPDFNQYRDRFPSQNNSNLMSQPSSHIPLPCNGSYEPSYRESYPAESRYFTQHERQKYGPTVRSEYSRIDLTRTVTDNRYSDKRIRNDKNLDERKRHGDNISNNIPDKLYRFNTSGASSRIDPMDRMAREQNELISKPVYNYASYKHQEAYQNEQKRATTSHIHYNESNSHLSRRYSMIHHDHYHDRMPSNNSNRNVIQKIPNHRDLHQHQHQHQIVPHNGLPADKNVLSILRNSLEPKHTGCLEPIRQPKEMPDLIVIDDGDDPVIEINDDNDVETPPKCSSDSLKNRFSSTLNHHIQMPKAVDSISRDSDYHRLDSVDSKSKSPESDVASRIRTKAELKGLPPSQDNSINNDVKKSASSENDKGKLLPKSQKQHLFNQIREDSRLESVIKNEILCETFRPEVKSEPINIEEIEKDVEPIKTQSILAHFEPSSVLISKDSTEDDDLDWTNACNSFVEQLKIGCHKKKLKKKRIDTLDTEPESKVEELLVESKSPVPEKPTEETIPITIKQEPMDEDEKNNEIVAAPEPPILEPSKPASPVLESEIVKDIKTENKNDKRSKEENQKQKRKTSHTKNKTKNNRNESIKISKNCDDKLKQSIKTVIKEELESTDDDEPLIKSKILKEKEQSERLKHQLLKDLSEKSAYVKLECCNMDLNKNNRRSLDLSSKEKEERLGKLVKQATRSKGKSLSIENSTTNNREDSSTDSDDDLSVASRLRTRKSIKSEENKNQPHKSPTKASPTKKIADLSNTSGSSLSGRKPGFGDSTYFHPGWEQELYKYKRSLRMPTRLIAIPRGHSGRPSFRGSGALFTRGSTSLPDLDPAPLSPAPSSAQSAATDDLCARRQDKLIIDSDLESNSSCSVANKLHYDSEASTSTVISTTKVKKKGSSIVDELIKKCGKKEESKKKTKDKEDKSMKINKTNLSSDLLPTPTIEITRSGNKAVLSAKKEKAVEDIFYLTTFRKQRASIKEVFGDERPASAPPSSRRDEDSTPLATNISEEIKTKSKPKKIMKTKLLRRSSSIREGLRSDKLLKRTDHKGRLLRIKQRNNLIKSLANKKLKGLAQKKTVVEKCNTPENKDDTKETETPPSTEVITKKTRFKRLFGRRKLSSGFDYIRKKKKIIRREDNAAAKIRRPAFKPSPESVHDIQKEIKGWFINKSIGETHLHRAARLGYTDCVAYCLEKMEADPSAKDNAGFTPLHVASARGHVRIARLLLQYGGDVSAAAQGGIRPLHEACENCHLEVIRLLLSYGADPLLVTYADQTPEELAEGSAAVLLRLHIADVQGRAIEPWRFPPPTEIIDRDELGCDPLSSPPPASPPPPPDSTIEIQCTEAPLPPFYSLRSLPGQPSDGLWCLLQDITNLLQIKSKESLLKQIHCGSGSPKELLREIRTQEFLERAQCHQLLCAGEKVNVRASKVALVRVTDKLRQLLKIETVLVS